MLSIIILLFFNKCCQNVETCPRFRLKTTKKNLYKPIIFQ